MAFGKNSRMDSRRSSSSYCSTATLVVFIALSLVGVWMMTSSAVIPTNVSNSVTKPDIKEEVSQTERHFEDGSGDVIEDVTNEQTTKDDNTIIEDIKPEITTETKEEETQEETPVKESEGKERLEESTKTQAYSDENGKTGDNGSGDAGVDSDGEGDRKEKQQQNEDEKEPDSEQSEDEKEKEKIQPIVEQSETKEKEEQTFEDSNTKERTPNEVFPDPAQSELLNETNTQTGSWSTQALESKKEKEAQKTSNGQVAGQTWKLCNVSAGPDYIPCLDNMEVIKRLHSTKHYEHRERHCPEESPTCLVPLPEGYKTTVKWPKSRDKIWYANVPHTTLAKVKGHQNWVKVSGEYLTFPGGGTQFKYGALHYIDFIQESWPDIGWGKQTRVILDVGCGVASFGGFLFEKDVLAMSFAPKDEHEAQVQFALERGIPAISAVMGTKRLPFPSRVFDAIHCARCRVPWHAEGGMLLLELNRLLRPGGYFIWSATPVYQDLPEDVNIWKAMSRLTKNICWEMVTMTKDSLNNVGVAIYRKPLTNECYDKRMENDPPLCKKSDDPNAAWNIPLQACMHSVPEDSMERGSHWPEKWPKRLETPPYWLNGSQIGVYGQAAPEDFKSDYKHWKRVVNQSYLTGMGINWSNIRNVMDMRSVYGGFAAALRDMQVWVMNVVSIDSADTLPVIFERGLFGIYHDWCESFSSYPRTYDLLHADHLFSRIDKRCKLLAVMAEVDRLLRPDGKLIVRDNVKMINQIENIAKSMQWEIQLTYSKEKEGLLCVQKTMWRPEEVDSVI